MPKSSAWEENKLLIIPTLWLGFSVYCAVNIIIPFIGQHWWFFGANVGFWAIFTTAYLKVWWYETEYKGLDINVREPHVGWAKMPYEIDAKDCGLNPFGAAFGWHLSAVLIPVEASIHMFMGNDLQRAAVDGDNETCIGMMAQEMNHGIAQLFYSRGAEKCLGYPAGYRQLWKIILIKIFSYQYRAAYLMWFEIFSMTFHLIFTFFPFIKVDHLFGKPYWTWNYHLMEEMEHSWDSVQDIKPKLPWFYKATFWVLTLPLMATLWVQALMQGLWYGRHTFWQHPTRLVTGFFIFATVWVQTILFVVSITFMEMILNMRPDSLYDVAKIGMTREYMKVDHYFKVTHKQKPAEHMKKVEGCPPASSVAELQAAREELYGKVTKLMRETGHSEKEIKRSSFTMAAETNKYNPML